MGSIDIPPFLRDKLKKSLQTTPQKEEEISIDTPDFLKKNESPQIGLPDLNNGTPPISPSLSNLESPSQSIVNPPQDKKAIVAANDQYAAQLDFDIPEVLSRSKRKIAIQPTNLGMGVVAPASSYNLPFSKFDPNDDKSYQTLIDELKGSSSIVSEDGKQETGTADLIKKLQQRKLLLISKRGLTTIETKAYPDFDEKQNEDYFKTKIEDASNRFLTTSKLVTDPSQSIKTGSVTAENFRYGLEELKTSDNGKYNNVLASLKEKGKVAEPDFERIAEIGQVIRNQKVLRDQASDMLNMDEESNIKYLGNSYESKKAIAAGKMGEWLKKNGGQNQSEFTEDQMRKAAKATGLNDQEILKDLIFTEKLVGVDAIPKSGVLPSFFDRGLFAPINSITTTLSGIGDTQAESYLKSNSLSGRGIGADKVIDSTGQAVDKLASDKDNIFYGAVEGLGQFATQVALTGGIGGIARAGVGTLTKGLIGEGATAALISSAEASKAAMLTGTFASTYLQEYGQDYEDALNKTGDVRTAKFMAASNAFAASGFELWLPEAEIASNMLGAFKKAGFAKTLLEIVKKGGDPKELLKEGTNAFVKFAGTTGNVILQETAEEIGTRITQQGIEMVYSPQTAKNVDLGNEIWETAKATTIQTLLPALLSGGSASLQKDFTQKSLHDAALNLEQYKRGFDELLANGKISQDDYNKTISLLQTHRNSIHNSPDVDANGNRIPREKRLEFATQQTSIKINNEKLKNAELSAPEISNLNKKIKEAEDIQESIFNPKTQTNEEQVTATAAETSTSGNVQTKSSSSEGSATQTEAPVLKPIIPPKPSRNATTITPEGQQQANNQQGSEQQHSRTDTGQQGESTEGQAQQGPDNRNSNISSEEKALVDKVRELKVPNLINDQFGEDENLKFLQEQSISAPNSFKNQIVGDENLATDLIATNSKEAINDAIAFQEKQLKAQDLTDNDYTEIDNHIKLLEKGLAKKEANEPKPKPRVRVKVGTEPITVSEPSTEVKSEADIKNDAIEQNRQKELNDIGKEYRDALSILESSKENTVEDANKSGNVLLNTLPGNIENAKDWLREKISKGSPEMERLINKKYDEQINALPKSEKKPIQNEGTGTKTVEPVQSNEQGQEQQGNKEPVQKGIESDSGTVAATTTAVPKVTPAPFIPPKPKRTAPTALPVSDEPVLYETARGQVVRETFLTGNSNLVKLDYKDGTSEYLKKDKLEGRKLTPQQIKNKENEKQKQQASPEQKGSESDNVNSQEAGRKKRKRIKGTRKANRKIKHPEQLKALTHEAVSPLEMALQYFIRGGKVNASAIEDIFGQQKSVGRKDINEEVRTRVNILNRSAKSLTEIAHSLWDNSSEEIQSKYDSQDFENAVIGVISDYTSQTKMAEALNKMFGVTSTINEDQAYSNWLDQTYEQFPHQEDVNDAIDYTYELTEEEKDRLLKEEEEGKEAYINQVTAQQEAAKAIIEQQQSEKDALERDAEEKLANVDKLQRDYDKKKAALGTSGQQDQMDIFGAKPSDELLFKNDLSEQQKIVAEAKQKLDEAKALYKQAQDKFDNFPVGSMPMFSFKDEVSATEDAFPISELNKIPKGRLHNKDLSKLKESISKDGIKEDLVLEYYPQDNALRLKEGHHRLAVANELGLQNVPIKVQVVWGKSIKDGNSDIDGQQIYHPPMPLDVESYKRRNYQPTNIDLSELGFKEQPTKSENKFSTKEDATPFETTDNRKATLDLLQKTYPDAIIKQSQDDLPQEILDQVPEGKTVEGVLHNGRVYMVADNLSSMGRAEGVYRHETIGHSGVIAELKGKLDWFVSSLVNNAKDAQRKALDKLSQKLFKKNSTELNEAQKNVLGQEYIAQAAEQPQNYPTTWEKIKSFVRGVLRDLGIKISVSDKDIKVLLNRAAKQPRIPFKVTKLSVNGITYSTIPVNPEVVNGFYSPIEKKLLEEKAANLSATKWLERFGKGDEVTYTGLRQFLESKRPDEQVTKKAIQDYLKVNRIEIREVLKGTDKKVTVTNKAGIRKFYGTPSEADAFIKNSGRNDLQVINETAVGGETKYSQHQLPGEKTGYKEVLITMPINRDKTQFKVGDRVVTGYGEGIVKEVNMSSSDKPYTVTMDNGKTLYFHQDQLKGGKEDAFYSSHFTEPNILVHLRMNIRNDIEGKKTLFLEELQSDWGQKGKKAGFATAESKKIISDLKEKITNKLKAVGIHLQGDVEQFYNDGKIGVTEMTPLYINRGVKSGDIKVDKDSKISELLNLLSKSFEPNASIEEKRKQSDYVKEVVSITREATEGMQGLQKKDEIPVAPFVTDTNAWTKLGLKVAMQHAVNEGAEKIAWTTGEQQNDRYDLGKTVDGISYRKNDDGTYYISGQKDGVSVIHKDNLSENELEANVGKDVTKRIINEEGDKDPNKPGRKLLTGDQLKVGGKGMIGFYGSPTEGKLGIVGNVAESLFGKGSVKTTEIDTGNGTGYDAVKYDGSQDISNVPGTDYLNKGDWLIKDPQGNFIYFMDKELDKTTALNEFYIDSNGADEFIQEGKGFQKQYSVDITSKQKAEVAAGLPLFSFAGEKENLAKNVRDNLEVARQMEVAGKSVDEIHLATGWERGKDEKWRYEISDAGKINRNATEIHSDRIGAKAYKMSDLFPNNDLYEAYPELKDVKVNVVTKHKLDENKSLGEWDGQNKEINIYHGENYLTERDTETIDGLKKLMNAAKGTAEFARKRSVAANISKKFPSDISSEQADKIIANEITRLKKGDFTEAESKGFKSILIHEIQHAIQDIEGFATGGNLLSGGFFPKEVFLSKDKQSRLKEIEKLLDQLDEEVLGEKRFFNKASKLYNEKHDILGSLEMSSEEAQYKYYKQLAGEVEARNAATRSAMTGVRGNIPFYVTEDVAREDQILYFGEGTQQSLPDDDFARHMQDMLKKAREGAQDKGTPHTPGTNKPANDYADEIIDWVKKQNPNATAEDVIKELEPNDDAERAELESYVRDKFNNQQQQGQQGQQQQQAAPEPTEKLSLLDEKLINKILSQKIDEQVYPHHFDMNEKLKQMTSITQSWGQDNREVLDGTYVKAHLADLKSISEMNSRILADSLGKNWKEKLVQFLEENTATGNVAQIAGLLNVMSTQVFQDISTAKTGKKISQLQDLQARIDAITYDNSRSASLALNQRRIYQEFAQGKPINDILSEIVLTPEQQQMKQGVEEALKQKFTDDELNKPKTKTPKTKSTTPKTKTPKAAPATKSPTVKDDLIAKGKAKAQGDSLAEKLKQAKDALNGFKC